MFELQPCRQLVNECDMKFVVLIGWKLCFGPVFVDQFGFESAANSAAFTLALIAEHTEFDYMPPRFFVDTDAMVTVPNTVYAETK